MFNTLFGYWLGLQIILICRHFPCIEGLSLSLKSGNVAIHKPHAFSHDFFNFYLKLINSQIAEGIAPVA